MKKRYRVGLGAGLLVSLATLATTRGADDLAQIQANFRDYYRQGSGSLQSDSGPAPDALNALEFARSLSPDGHWADVDYANTEVSGWSPATHANRIQAMAIAAIGPTISPQQHTVLVDAANSALDAWREKDYQSRNWWFNQIGTPKQLGVAAILLDKDLKPENREFLIHSILARSKFAMTGQNMVWLAGNILMRAVLTHDDPLAAKAATAIWGNLTLSTAEGIQPDWSFHQHGPQQQFGNYGGAFAVEMQRFALLLHGTSLAISPEKLPILRHYLLEGQNWVSWRGTMDISSCGRQLFPDGPLARTRAISGVMANMAQVDTASRDGYLAFVQRNKDVSAPNDLQGFRWFWRSDYGVFRAAEMSVSIKFCSPRVIGMESLNGENLCGYYLADGATYLYRSGGEYRDIFPLWDWRRIPGVTAPGGSQPVKQIKSLQLPGLFAGGVSNGQRGCAALDYHRDGVVARKSWFVSGSSLVCLGAGITADVGQPILTSVNQSWRKGQIRLHAGERESLWNADGLRQIESVSWLEHDGLRYEFPGHPALTLGGQKQAGSWKKVFASSATPPGELTGELFSIWFDHGSKPAQASYAYGVSPAGHAAGHTERYEILANQVDLQAVRWASGAAAAVFWQPGALSLAPQFRVEVGSPCLLMLEGKRLWVSDPTQKLPSLTLKCNDQTRKVELPTAGLAGSSVALEWP